MRDQINEITAEVQPALAAAAMMAARKIRAAVPQIQGSEADFKGTAFLSLEGAFRLELVKALEIEADIGNAISRLGPVDPYACATRSERDFYRGYNKAIEEVQALMLGMGIKAA